MKLIYLKALWYKKIEDHHSLTLWLKANNEFVYKTSTLKLIIEIPNIVNYLNLCVSLKRADIISKVTPKEVSSGFSLSKANKASLGNDFIRHIKSKSSLIKYLF